MKNPGNSPKISEAEWHVMEVIWKSGTISTAEIVKQARSGTSWKDNTIYTLLSRLAKKKMIKVDKTVSPNLCTPLVERQECQKAERKSFIRKVYNGSLSLMLANIMEDENLTEHEIDQLKAVLDRKSSEKKKAP